MYLPANAFGCVQRSFPRKSGECSRASDAARRIVLDAAPAVILLEESSVLTPACDAEGGRSARPAHLESAVSDLAASAPVVVVGGATLERELAALVAVGLADFVAHRADAFPLRSIWSNNACAGPGKSPARRSTRCWKKMPLPKRSVKCFATS
jgi:hypothetical protein